MFSQAESQEETIVENQNDHVIEEFRAHAGKVGDRFAGSPLLLLTTTGAKTGKQYTTPLRYLAVDDAWVVFAANGGAQKHPGWYYNVIASSLVTVELEAETFEARATVLVGEDRERFITQQVQRYPQFATYLQKTTREIPVIALHRSNSDIPVERIKAMVRNMQNTLQTCCPVPDIMVLPHKPCSAIQIIKT
jgi:deazaflavin-dependent oxidoreductase (nitroreductase family)